MKTTLYYIIICAVAVVAVLFAVTMNEQYCSAKELSPLPGVYYHEQTFYQSLIQQFWQNIQNPAVLWILQLVVIVLVAKLCGSLLKFVGQPVVVGEIVGGILLGPSLLGAIAPGVSQFLFPAGSLSRLQTLSELGLVIYMFLVGTEIDLKRLKQGAARALLISHSGIVMPFALGIVLSIYLYSAFAPQGVSFLSFALFIGVAMSITAFPVLARIIKEKNLSGSELGFISISSSAIEDITAWTLLAMVVAASKTTSVATSVISLVLMIIFAVLALFLVKPLLQQLYNRLSRNQRLQPIYITIIVLVIFISALVSSLLGMHALFGAFLAGLVVPENGNLQSALKDQFEGFTTLLLLPVFFALTGLKTQVNFLGDSSLWLPFLLILLVAVMGKFGGVVIAARLSKMDWKSSLAMGVLMNTRGLMELVALNVGYDMGIISRTVFTMMVLMAIITTLATGPLLNLVLSPQSAKNPL